MHEVFFIVKSFISRNKSLYTAYYHLYIRHKYKRLPWFSKETQIYYDGYPRSGNTFLDYIFRNVFKKIKSTHHFHKIAPIKIAFDKQIPVFILIRKPFDAITSYYLKYYSKKESGLPEKVNIKLLDQLTTDYIRYYEFVIKKKDELNIIQFDDLISNPYEIIYKIGKSIDQEYEEDDIKSALLTFKGTTDKLGSSKPNAYKQKKKLDLTEYLNETKNYSKAIKIYEKIIQLHN